MNRLTFTPWQRRRLQRQLKETADARAYRRTWPSWSSPAAGPSRPSPEC
jgi:hypothetical protein